MENSLSTMSLDTLVNKLIDLSVSFGSKLLVALLVFFIGRWIVKKLNRLVINILTKRHVEASLATFTKSLVSITLNFTLVIIIISVLGIETSSFIALFASAGVAVGMALSGNLANFAGGLIILLFKPFKVGDYVEVQGTGGTVKEIQIFHTILATPDNKMVYIPNGSLSSGAVTNFSRQATRRVDWTFGVDYGEDYDKVKAVIETILARDSRILTDPAPFIALHALADSSVNIVVRVWVESSDYWDVYFGINQAVYATFNEKGINFPFPQLTVHRADN